MLDGVTHKTMNSMYIPRQNNSFPRVLAFVLLLLAAASVGAESAQSGKGVPEGKPTPEMLNALAQKKKEAERLRQRVEELEALLRMKNEISEAKSRAIEQLEAAKQQRPGK